jgi:hypothetical protein
MINAIWSFRNCNPKGIKALDLILPLFSVIMWKRNHPNHKTKVYLDKDYFDKFTKNDILQFWDEFVILDPIEGLNIEHIWSISKFEAINREDGPFVLLDGDLIALSNFNDLKFFDHEISVPLLEETSNTDQYAYLDPADAAEFGGLSRDEFIWDEFADNMSIVFWNHSELKEKYLAYFQKYLSAILDKPLGENPLGYLLFIEQKIFYELCKSLNVNKKYLLKDAHKISTGEKLPNVTNGEIPLEDSHHYVIHYGTSKNVLKDPIELKKHLDEYVIPVTGEFFEKYFREIYNKENKEK